METATSTKEPARGKVSFGTQVITKELKLEFMRQLFEIINGREAIPQLDYVISEEAYKLILGASTMDYEKAMKMAKKKLASEPKKFVPTT